MINSPVLYQKWLLAGMESAQSAMNSGVCKAALSLQSNALSAAQWANTQSPQAPLLCLAGPEGGLSPQEEAAALAAGFSPITLGSRTLRYETAPLAALALWILS